MAPKGLSRPRNNLKEKSLGSGKGEDCRLCIALVGFGEGMQSNFLVPLPHRLLHLRQGQGNPLNEAGHVMYIH